MGQLSKGNYVLHVTKGCFLFGKHGESKLQNSHAQVFHFDQTQEADIRLEHLEKVTCELSLCSHTGGSSTLNVSRSLSKCVNKVEVNDAGIISPGGFFIYGLHAVLIHSMTNSGEETMCR